MSDRRIADLCVELQPKARQFLLNANARVAPSYVCLTTTWRTGAEQAVAHATGRSNAAPGQSPHECCLANGTPASRAFDWGVFNPDGSYVRDGQDARYAACGVIVKGLGMKWGGEFHKPDFDHAELMDWQTA